LSVDRETRGGTPVIAGTRVPYDAVAGLAPVGVLAAGARLLVVGEAPGPFGIMVLIFEPLLRRLMDGREELWCHIGWSGGAYDLVRDSRMPGVTR
jgi:hypothetical protein